MDNLHISLTEFKHESRVIKEALSVARLEEVDRVFIAALHLNGLPRHEELSAQIYVNRFSLRTRGLGKGLGFQLLKYIEFVLRVLFCYRKMDVGIVNVHSLGLLPLGFLFKVIYRAKLVYDTHELETETNGLSGLRKKLSKWVERLLIKSADHIFVVSESIADWYVKTYGIPRPTVVLNSPSFQIIDGSDHFRKKFRLRDDQIIFLYQGGLSVGRGVELLLETFQNRKNDNFVLVFMGYGSLEPKIVSAAKVSDKIFFHNAVPADSILSFTRSADFGVSLIESTCLSYYFCMPNKLFEYVMSGLPVLVSNMKEMRQFVEGNKIGVVVQEQTQSAINLAIEQLTCMELQELKSNARKTALEYSWEHQEKKMLKSYKRLLESE